MRGVPAIIFDYYETLAELSREMRERVFDDLARRVGVDLPPGEAYRHWRQQTENDAALRIGGQVRPPLDGPIPPFRTFGDVWRERFAELFRQWALDAPAGLGVETYRSAHAEAALYRDVLPAFDLLRGEYQLAVLSDADNDFLAASLERNALTFDIVVSSEDLRAYKPHVSMFREVCARLGVDAAETLYVGDSPWADIAGARNAGPRAVWLNRHGAAWPEDIEPPEVEVVSLEQLLASLTA